MAKLTVNIGTSANDRTGDNLRTAFNKINTNFTELYTALGLDDASLNLGAFEFTGSVMTTTDSSAITIDQAVTVSSDLTVGGDVVPSTDLGSSLGSATKRFKDLYISNNTIFLGNTSLGVSSGGDLTVGGASVSSVIDYNDIQNKPTLFDGAYSSLSGKPTIPADVGDLTDTGNLFFDRSYNSLTDTPTIPTAVSQLTNDSGFITSADIAGGTLTVDVNNTGDLQGSVFADDSTLLVDATDGSGYFNELTLNSSNVKLGSRAGDQTTQSSVVAIGSDAGRYAGDQGIAIGRLAGAAGANSIAIGASCGTTNQGNQGIAIGYSSGRDNQGNYGIALGFRAGQNLQHDNTIIINAADGVSSLDSDGTNRLYINPIRNSSNLNFLKYNTTTKEVTYESLLSFTGDLQGSVFADDSTLLVDGVNGVIPYSVLSGVPTIPTDVGDLTDTGNLLLGGGSLVGDLTGSVFADDSTRLINGVEAKINLNQTIENNTITSDGSDFTIQTNDLGYIKWYANGDLSIASGQSGGDDIQFRNASRVIFNQTLQMNSVNISAASNLLIDNISTGNYIAIGTGSNNDDVRIGRTGSTITLTGIVDYGYIVEDNIQTSEVGAGADKTLDTVDETVYLGAKYEVMFVTGSVVNYVEFFANLIEDEIVGVINAGDLYDYTSFAVGGTSGAKTVLWQIKGGVSGTVTATAKVKYYKA